jgi:hypothetical protein
MAWSLLAIEKAMHISGKNIPVKQQVIGINKS